jgi:hypothetical protein
MGHVASVEEVVRLSQRHNSCMLVGNAQHVLLASEE